MKIIRFWFPVAVYSVMIFCVSSVPGGDKGITIPKADKILHIIEYFPFGFLLCLALKQTFFSINKYSLLFLVTIGSFVYGLSDEFHQSFVPLRDSSLLDAFADLVGGFSGGLAYYLLNKRRK